MVSASMHHHRSTTKSSNKAFKSRHATKSFLKTQNKGKVDDSNKLRPNHHQQMMSKLDRRNKARQKQSSKHKDLELESKIFKGRDAAPRIVAVVPLCESVSPASAVRSLLKSLDVQAEIPEEGLCTTWIERFKQKIQWIVLPREMLAVIDGCKVADYVMMVIAANQEVDEYGETLIRSIETQGVSTTCTVVQHLGTIEPAKQRSNVKDSLLKYIGHFFPTTNKVHDLESLQEGPNVIRSICASNPKGIHWRDDRTYLLAEEVIFDEDKLVVTGVVRGRGMSADRLIHIQGHGDFQIEKICAYPSAIPSRHNAEAMAVDSTPDPSGLKVLDAPTEDQEDLLELAPEEDVMQDVDDNVSEAPTAMSESRRGVLLDDHHYFDDDLDQINAAYEPPKKLPKGTSKYQQAWYIDGEDYGSEEESDEDEDVDMDEDAPEPRPEDGLEGRAGPSGTEYGTEYGDDAKSEMFLDPSPDQEYAQIQAFRDRQTEADEDREFPDEIELPPNVSAHERLARYRGLKSIRTSKWETSEDRAWQPADWDRLALIQNYKTTKNRIINEARAGGVAPGTRVIIYLRGGTPEMVEAFKPSRPFVLWGLLRHEHKQAVVSVTISMSKDYAGETVKAKDELIFQIGSRRLHVNPIFSAAGGIGPNGITKFERFLTPGMTSIATFVGPVTWGAVPVVVWRRGDDGDRDWTMIGQGSFVDVNRERVIAKRIVLTGHPYKIHKRLVTVRYMFFNTEDVNWFKAIPLFTRRGRSGFIKESLGTHGYFKATFDGKINPQDAVALSLYKRVFPRGSTEFQE
ncbi:hypothetical protein EDC01DRAFT_648069 [Geopyxis carbonaria]|nr:hypothetical protein EDC01DRAFT_648069 [Geopyxis carbonaria]